MKKAAVYIHGKGGGAFEAEHYAPLFGDRDVIGYDYKAGSPREAKEEFTEYFGMLFSKYESVVLIANSIGAFFAMNAVAEKSFEKAYFISPIVDMEKLICDMMKSCGISESELREKGEIKTPFGETLSYAYLRYVRENPIKWGAPTHIIYGENDALTSFDTVSAFAEKTGATLDVMRGGEHWFHTEEQMKYIDELITRYESGEGKSL